MRCEEEVVPVMQVQILINLQNRKTAELAELAEQLNPPPALQGGELYSSPHLVPRTAYH
jgi:hypothetical protein